MVPHHDHDKKTHVCEICGGEADLIIKEDKLKDSPEVTPKTRTLGCKVCGSEADTIFEEI
jgi:hypothetical protein